MSEVKRALALTSSLFAVSLGSFAIGEYKANNFRDNRVACETELQAHPALIEDCLKEVGHDSAGYDIVGFAALAGGAIVASAIWANLGEGTKRRDESETELDESIDEQ
jgi:hypothetical protein